MKKCAMVMLCAFASWCFVASAQSSGSSEKTVKVPSYMTFLESCTTVITEAASDINTVTQEQKMGMSAMMCHCAYEELVPRPAFNASQFESALLQCINKAKSDEEAFAQEYYRKVKASLAEYDDGSDDW